MKKLFLSPRKVTSTIAMKTNLKRKKNKEVIAEYTKRRALKKVENQELSAKRGSRMKLMLTSTTTLTTAL